MSKRYDDDFFDDLDKTTDLLKAFKSHIDTDKELGSLDDLYTEFNMNKKSNSIKSNVVSKNDIERNSSSKYSNVEQNKSISDYQKRNVSEIVNKVDNKNDDSDFYIPVKKTKQVIKKEASQVSKTSPKKTDISEIIGKMNTSVEKSKKIKQEKERKTKEIRKSKTKEPNKKWGFNIFEKVFIAFSVLFILGCGVVYGSRFFNSSNKDNDSKNLMSLSSAITKNSSLVDKGDGLYTNSGDYVYKGSNVNNYVLFSNMKWRIIKTNHDGTMDLVLDDYINTLSWNREITLYTNSDIHKYLNEYFIKYLNKDYLTTTTICKDQVSNVNQFSCTGKDEGYYVRLLSVEDYLNSKTDTSYIAGATDNLWLNTTSTDKVWQIKGNTLVLAPPSQALGVKPVIRLKDDIVLISGDGSSNNPYVVEEKSDNINVGDYVKLDKDIYIVYDIEEDNLNLVLNGVLPNPYHYSKSTNIYNASEANSLAHYLNNTYYNSLTYKDKLIEKEWNVGVYTTSYADTTKSTTRAKIGLYGLIDLKFNNELNNYFILNGISTNIYVYGNVLTNVKPVNYHNIRPAISIKNEKITSGDGSLENPYILGE